MLGAESENINLSFFPAKGLFLAQDIQKFYTRVDIKPVALNT